jgi:hypothetical protein
MAGIRKGDRRSAGLSRVDGKDERDPGNDVGPRERQPQRMTAGFLDDGKKVAER